MPACRWRPLPGRIRGLPDGYDDMCGAGSRHLHRWSGAKRRRDGMCGDGPLAPTTSLALLMHATMAIHSPPGTYARVLYVWVRTAALDTLWSANFLTNHLTDITVSSKISRLAHFPPLCLVRPTKFCKTTPLKRRNRCEGHHPRLRLNSSQRPFNVCP